MRIASGLSQYQLAERLGEGRQRLAAYEQGRNGVPLDLAARWADACGHELVVKLQDKRTLSSPQLDARDQAIVDAVVAGLRTSESADYRMMLLMISEAMSQRTPASAPQATSEMLVNDNEPPSYGNLSQRSG